MRRSICVTEPPSCLAGEIGTWSFIYQTASALPKGAKLKFDIQSKGRGIDWEIPFSDLSEEGNVIYAHLEDGTPIEADELEIPDSIVPQFEFTLPSAVKVGSKIIIVMGAAPQIKQDEKNGNACQLSTGRRRSFLLYIDPKGKGNYDEPEIFSMDVKGNILKTIRILAPSFVAKNKRFDITVRFEDEFGNLTSNAPEGTLIDLSYEHLRENLNWKLFVPETGFVILPNLYFNEAGIYRIQLKNLGTQATFISAPIKCFQENDRNLFWGLLHGESEKYDSTENIESCLRHFRDEKHYNFFATSPFDAIEETSNDVWKSMQQNVADFNEEDRFISFLGSQYLGAAGSEGLRKLIYLKDGKPFLRSGEAKYSSLAKVYKQHSPRELLAIPSFTMGKPTLFDYKELNPEFERVVEIYNAWGCSLSTKKQGNPRPIGSEKNDGIEADEKGCAEAALQKGARFGFVAGGLDDRGIYSEFYDSTQWQYSPGLTGILASKQTRDSIFEALFNRSCYATTGARIIVGFYIVGHRMGSELLVSKKRGLKVNRHISGYIAGESELASIEIIRNGEVCHTITPENTYHADYTYDDMEPIEKVTLPGGKEKPPFVYYYVRVTQKDGEIAWSSPIWIDNI